MDCKEAITQLNDKITKYEGIIQELLDDKSKSIGIVVSNPISNYGRQVYRINMQGSETIGEYQQNLFFKSKLVPKIGDEVLVVGNQIIDIIPKSLDKPIEKVDFDFIKWEDIGGLKSQIEKIKEAIELPLNNAKLAKELNIEPIKGILLYGPPGCGKTLIARAIASSIINTNKDAHECFTYIKGAELLSEYVGIAERNIKRIFERAREFTKKTSLTSVIFIDEAEAILPQRGSRRSSDVDRTVVPTFLSEMDGFDKYSPIVILSTNLPGDIDTAILREGRVDIKINVNRPTQQDTEEIFNIHLNKSKCALSTSKLAKDAADLLYSSKKNQISGAMVQTIVKTSARKAFSRSLTSKAKAGITLTDIEESINLIE